MRLRQHTGRCIAMGHSAQIPNGSSRDLPRSGMQEDGLEDVMQCVVWHGGGIGCCYQVGHLCLGRVDFD